MIYACDYCHFTFSRVGKIEIFPACDKPFVREATEEEKNEHQEKYVAQEEKNKG